MWIFLNNAFLSIVVDKKAADGNLLVRARRQGDIDRTFPMAKVTQSAKTDYRYRASLPRQLVAAAIADEISRISYSNFKDSVPKKEHERHSAYLRVWATMEGFQQPRRRNPPKDYGWESRWEPIP